jgi:thiamine pyrophosphate-dependent acetolactate synthase large subunit-like protein
MSDAGNIQKYGGRVIATDLHSPHFVKLAESFGALGLPGKGPRRWPC